jgi:hypothetical protein
VPGAANEAVLVAVPAAKLSVPFPSTSQAYDATLPSGSPALAVSVKVWPLSGDAGSEVIATVGARLATAIVFV